jgi:exosortase
MSSLTIHSQQGSVTRAHLAFGSFVAVSTIVFWRTLGGLVSYSLSQESASHVVLIPFISAFLLFTERDRIFSVVRPSIPLGASLIFLGGIAYWKLGSGSLPLATLALVFVWVGAFICSYGLAAARAAAFPLLFLLLMVPLPDATLAWTIQLLQQGSTEVAYLLFKLLGVPVLRQGFILSVPTVTIEVAVECSGIRSSVALLITCLLAAHFYLRTSWKILLFILLVIPLTVIKNGIRIATLTLLSIYVDPSFLHGNLHRDGGFVFFFLALVLLLPVLLLLEKSEHRPSTP